MKKLRIGIIGCGTIGTEIALAARKKLRTKAVVTALYDKESNKSLSLSRSLKKNNVMVSSLRKLLDKCDFVVESASGHVAGEILRECVKYRKDSMFMSVGGLIGAGKLLNEASKKGVKIFLPSGAICGLDGIKAAKFGGIKKVKLTTLKPPKALRGAPYLKKSGIKLDSLKKETVIFSGSAMEAVKNFPKNINVASVLCMAGIGARSTRVEIIAVPGIKRNTHKIEVEGDFGRMRTVTENVPSETNPKTSRLAALSAIAVLAAAADSVRIGT